MFPLTLRRRFCLDKIWGRRSKNDPIFPKTPSKDGKRRKCDIFIETFLEISLIIGHKCYKIETLFTYAYYG